MALLGKYSFPAEYCRNVAKEGVGGKEYRRGGFVMEAYFVA